MFDYMYFLIYSELISWSIILKLYVFPDTFWLIFHSQSNIKLFKDKHKYNWFKHVRLRTKGNPQSLERTVLVVYRDVQLNSDQHKKYSW